MSDDVILASVFSVFALAPGSLSPSLLTNNKNAYSLMPKLTKMSKREDLGGRI
jgi:hypothetical protein